MNKTPDRLAPLQFYPMDEAAARSISSWRYEAPYEIYSMDGEDADKLVSVFVKPEYGYHAIIDRAGTLAGYCCFGADGQVPGGDYDNPALDIGLGVRPDLTGQGLGATFVSAVLRFARQEMTPTELRVTVAEFNKRALRVWQKAGFQPVQKFERAPDGKRFVVLTMGAGHGHLQQASDWQ